MPKRQSPPLDVSGIEPIDEGRTAEFLQYWLKQRPDLDAEALAIELTVARINLLSRKSVARIAESLGVTQTDYRIMAVIKRGRKEGAVRPSDLWKLFNLTPSAITYRIARLVDRGLVDRSAQSGDRRVILLQLTPDGDQIVHAVMTEVSALLQRRLTAIDGIPGGRALLRRLLGALARAWEQETEDDLPDEED